MEFVIAEMARLLGRSENDESITTFFGTAISRIEHDEHYGSLEFKTEGVEAVFKEEPWVLPPQQVTNEKMLHLVGFHLHGAGHEGYKQFQGALPGLTRFGDSRDIVESKLGRPLRTGGAGISRTLGKRLPSWIRYRCEAHLMQLQFDETGSLEMITILLEESVRPGNPIGP